MKKACCFPGSTLFSLRGLSSPGESPEALQNPNLHILGKLPQDGSHLPGQQLRWLFQKILEQVVSGGAQGIGDADKRIQPGRLMPRSMAPMCFVVQPMAWASPSWVILAASRAVRIRCPICFISISVPRFLFHRYTSICNENGKCDRILKNFFKKRKISDEKWNRLSYSGGKKTGIGDLTKYHARNNTNIC